LTNDGAGLGIKVSPVELCALFFLLLILNTSPQCQTVAPNPAAQAPLSQIVLLIDINADQDKVFALEKLLAQDMLCHLRRQGFVFPVIAFGPHGSRVINSGTDPDETLAAIRNLSLEAGEERSSAAPHLYQALQAATRNFNSDRKSKALLVISGGREDMSYKEFKTIRSTLSTNQIVCHVAIVSSHALYGTRAIQVRGFYLRNLAAKTHGKYVELGKREDQVLAVVAKLTERILLQSKQRSR